MSSNQVENKIERPPVVVIMGHIDHGKSTLLDFIRSSNVVAGEAGGITQHIAAYEVEHEHEGTTKRVTFLDTPGHEAFCDVRARGAHVADVAVLIVSAEDGVKPQTLEAYECIKKDGLPFVVAINKIDSPKADVEKTKNSLMENEIYLEGFGGDVPFSAISAKTGENMNELLDVILLVSEVEEHFADPTAPASGIIVEAHKDKFKGITATCIIKDGSLTKGQFLACEGSFTPVRRIDDHNGQEMQSASFSTPVTLSGWNNLPSVGLEFLTFKTKKEADVWSKEDQNKKTPTRACVQSSEEVAVIPIIIKTDVAGTGEAIIYELNKLETDHVKFNVLYTGSGNINETDMKRAATNKDTIIVGFGVALDKQAQAVQERENIPYTVNNIIYEIIEWLEEISSNRKPYITVEVIGGAAKVLKTFSTTKNTHVIGGKMKEGELKVGQKVRILRRDEEIDNGIIKELQQQKVKSQSVAEGEFGAAIESKFELTEGDRIESVEIVEK